MKSPGPLAGLLLGAVLCSAQETGTLEHDRAVRDVTHLVTLLETTHPDPYSRFGGKVEFKRAAQRLVASIPAAGLTVASLRDRLSVFLSRLRDGHTYVLGPSDTWRDPGPRLPVLFGVAADGLFLSAAHPPSLDGVRGWRVVAANAVPLDELISRYDASGRENIFGGYQHATVFLRSLVAMNAMTAASPEGTIRLTLESPDGRQQTHSVSWDERTGVPSTLWRQPPVRWRDWPQHDEVFWSHLIDTPRVGYLRVGTLMGREGLEMARRTNLAVARSQVDRYYERRGRIAPVDLESAIAGVPSLVDTASRLLTSMKARGVPALIVDLRGNDGGWTPSAVPLLHVLYGDAFHAMAWPGEYVTVTTTGEYVFTKESAAAAGEQRRIARIEEYRAAGFSFASAIEALGGAPIYRPDTVIVLCDHATFSAAFHLLVWLKLMGAVVVGVPPRQSPNAFMDGTEFTLAESGIRGSISRSVQHLLPGRPHEDVLQPDFPVTIDVFRGYDADVDAVLRYALDLFAAGRLQR